MEQSRCIFPNWSSEVQLRILDTIKQTQKTLKSEEESRKTRGPWEPRKDTMVTSLVILFLPQVPET